METQQEIKDQLASFGEVLKTIHTNSIPQLPQKQNELPQSMKLSSLPPMVATDRVPDDIVGEIMNFADKEVLIKLLGNYQKSKPDWDNYRHKLPEVLLGKFTKVLQECRRFGFIAPKVQGEELVWKRILGFKRNQENADQCSMCHRSQRAGDCKGRAVNKSGQMMFKPCWR